MQHVGRLILVTGYSGAGKSTLARTAATVPGVYLFKTTTTRPQRPLEAMSEYEFVTPDEYAARRQASHQWDHTEFGGYSYGADVEAMNNAFSKGKHYICPAVPDPTVIEDMKQLYAAPVTVIWIDTPLSVANSRIADDKQRAAPRCNSSLTSYLRQPAISRQTNRRLKH